MRKLLPFLLSALLCGTAAETRAQDAADNRVVIETTQGDYEGRWYFNVAPYEAEYVEGCWIDWNDNGIADEGEEITEDDWMNSVQHDIVSRRITIHGDITYLNLYGLTLSNIDIGGTGTLEFLDVSGNLLEDIDLSANTSLKDLVIGDNPLTSIDLVHAPQLRLLNMSFNPGITRIDLSSQKELKEFVFTDNDNISQFDFSANPRLQFLYLEAVPLTSIDLTPNTSLSELNIAFSPLSAIKLPAGAPLKSVALHNNALSGTLDLSGYGTLTDIFFQNNSISTLKIDEGLKDLYIISCFMNDLRTASFMPVIDGLYDRSSDPSLERGCIFMVDSEPVDEDVTDNNSLTTSAVDRCMEKGWDVIDYAGANMYPYLGIDDDVTSADQLRADVRSIRVTCIGGSPAVIAPSSLMGATLTVCDDTGRHITSRRLTTTFTRLPELSERHGIVLFNVAGKTMKKMI